MENERIEAQNVTSVTEQKVEKVRVKDQIANAITEKNISDSVLNNLDKLVNENQLSFPVGYNVGNAVKLAYSDIMNKGFINTCSAGSIANTLIEYAIQGLDIAQNQCYFINYGGKLTMQRSYFGDIYLAKRMGLIKEAKAYVVRQGEPFEIEMIKDKIDGSEQLVVKKHVVSFETLDNDIVGAYCYTIQPNGKKEYTIMTIKQIQKNWDLSKDNSRKFQKNFQEEACKRTVFRRHFKMIFNTALNNEMREDLRTVLESSNRTMQEEYINDNSTKKTADFEYDSSQEIIKSVQSNEIVEDDFDD